MKKLLRSIKNKDWSTNSRREKNYEFRSSSSHSHLSLSTASLSSLASLATREDKFMPLKISQPKEANKISIQNMIYSHPLIANLNNNKHAHDHGGELLGNKQQKPKSSRKKSPILPFNRLNQMQLNVDDVDFNKTKSCKDRYNTNNTNEISENYFPGKCTDSRMNHDHNNNNNLKKSKKPLHETLKNEKCYLETIKKKYRRANKEFYNGNGLIKQDKHHQNAIKGQSHAVELLDFLNSLKDNNTMCDLAIVVGAKNYPAHRLALAMFSEKYRNEFEKQLHSKNLGVYTICLKNSSNLAVKAIIKYIYTAKIDINPANVEEILNAAKELYIDDLICMCQDYLTSLSIGDVLDYMRNLLDKDGSELMLYELYVYMMTHIDKISRTPEFLKSSVNVVRALLGDSHLCVKSEMDVVEAALQWIKFDRGEKISEKILSETLKCVRFTLISPEELVSKVEPSLDGIKDENGHIFRMIFNAYKYHALNDGHSKLNNFMKREDCRNKCLKGESVPEDFVKAVRELAHIAHKLKSEREIATNTLFE